jgi:hypothetical protein
MENEGLRWEGRNSKLIAKISEHVRSQNEGFREGVGYGRSRIFNAILKKYLFF